MKLSLLTYNMAKDLTLDQLIDCANKFGYAALEFRVNRGHEHGVELERTKQERQEIKRKLEDAYLPVACIATGSRFDSTEEKIRNENIETAKKYIELASDLDCKRIRVFGNDIPEGVKAEDCVKWVGEALRKLGEFSEDFGVEVCLEMHGQFNFWKYALNAVRFADHSQVGIIYNCDPKDIIAGSIKETYGYISDYISHIHMHNLESDYPYIELFKLLQKDGFDGYLSSEASATEDPERVIAMYADLWRAYVRLAQKEQYTY